MAHINALPPVKRHITTHDEETGKSVFSSAFPEISPTVSPDPTLGFSLTYTTTGHPVSLAEDADLKSYQARLLSPPGLVLPGGVVLRHVDFAPGTTCAMHRTVSIDFGVMLEGEIECVLDSGETRLLARGDTVVQRGTMHAWRNTSETEWARMVFVLLESEKLTVKGEQLEEALGTAEGIVEKSGN